MTAARDEFLCLAESCVCWEWERDELDGVPRHGGAMGEPTCIGPVTTGDPADSSFIGFIYHQKCGCPAMATDRLCWGCYLESK